MSPEDTELIEALRAGIADRVRGVQAPDAMTSSARRIARRRATGRTLAAGLPVLALAGAVVAALGGHARVPRAGVSTATGTSPGVQVHDTAYVVRRIRASLAGGSRARVVEIISRGTPSYRTQMYVDPRSGVQYQRDVAVTRRGQVMFVNSDIATPIHDVLHFHTVSIDYQDHTWMEEDTVAAGPMSRRRIHLRHPVLSSSPRQVRAALANGTVTLHGTATVDGTAALVLSLTRPRSELYVDARTYRPLRAVIGNMTWSWLPATAANVASAKAPRIPRGYRRAPATS